MLAPKIVIPGADHKQLRCRCGHMDLAGHVRPLPRGGAVQGTVCHGMAGMAQRGTGISRLRMMSLGKAAKANRRAVLRSRPF